MITIWEHYPAMDCKTYAPIALPILEGGVSETVYCPFCRDLFVQATIGGLASGESVTGRIEGSLDGENWDNLAADGEDEVIDVNRTILLKYPGAVPPYIRASGFTTTGEESVATLELKFHLAIMV